MNPLEWIRNSLASMAARWLQSFVTSFGSVGNLLAVAAVIAGLYLAWMLAKKLAGRLGIGTGPLVAVLLVLAAVFVARNGRTSTPRPAAGSSILARAKAFQERQRMLARQRQPQRSPYGVVPR